MAWLLMADGREWPGRYVVLLAVEPQSQASETEWTRGEGLRVTEDAAKKMADVVMIGSWQWPVMRREKYNYIII
jgi:hypothetical protein